MVMKGASGGREDLLSSGGLRATIKKKKLAKYWREPRGRARLWSTGEPPALRHARSQREGKRPVNTTHISGEKNICYLEDEDAKSTGTMREAWEGGNHPRVKDGFLN